METNEQLDASSRNVSSATMIWAIVAFIFAIVICINNNSPMILGAGFFAKTFAVILATILGVIGVLIGDALRRFVKPDFIFTTGGFAQLLWIKIFWRVGPQLIGLFLGVFFGFSIVLG